MQKLICPTLPLFKREKKLIVFIIAHTYLINIFLRIVKSQCSPFSTTRKKNRPHTLFPLTPGFSKDISQEKNGVNNNKRIYKIA